MAAAGAPDRAIGEELGVSWRTVLRARQRHGIPSTWQPKKASCGAPGPYKRGCRCQICRQANLARLAAGKADRFARRAAGTAVFTHGSSGYRNWGCRCVTCSAGHKAACRAEYEARQAAL
ncbi:hypothetical protein ACFW9O_25110 [Streptomyces sp. NPDC059499]|uniref:hypothetical protein n=1 Tax=Streptomyces sp. NPDC059499 TaxID=3346852 RepID=UPI0036893D83